MLARRFPEAKIAFSGGDAGILYKSGSEAEGAQTLLTALGVPRGPADPRGEVARHLRERGVSQGGVHPRGRSSAPASAGC